MRSVSVILMLFVFLTSGCANKEKATAYAAIEQMTSTFVDPDSVQIRDLHYALDNSASDKLWVCGEVNAKNKFGGYVGFQKFVITVYLPLRASSDVHIEHEPQSTLGKESYMGDLASFFDSWMRCHEQG
jgi:hypothetical protein